jgi:hypothetical protein
MAPSQSQSESDVLIEESVHQRSDDDDQSDSSQKLSDEEFPDIQERELGPNGTNYSYFWLKSCWTSHLVRVDLPSRLRSGRNPGSAGASQDSSHRGMSRIEAICFVFFGSNIGLLVMRTRVSDSVRRELEDLYDANPYPSRPELMALRDKLNLTAKQVFISVRAIFHPFAVLIQLKGHEMV